MSRFRFSLLGLAGFVACFAMGCAALVYASPVIAGLFWSVTVLALAFATLAAAVRSPPHRFWWLGFAMFGWLHVLTMLGPFSAVAEWMQVNKLLEQAALLMPKARTTVSVPAFDVRYGIAFTGGAPPGSGSFEFYGGTMPGGTGLGALKTAPSTVQAPNTDYIAAFVRTSLALLTLLLACLGGFAGRLIHERNRSNGTSSTGTPRSA